MTTNDYVREVTDLINSGYHQEALDHLRPVATRKADFFDILQLSRLTEKLDFAQLNLSPIRIALTGSCTLDQFVELLRFRLILNGLAPEIYIAPFGTMDQSLLDPASELYAFKPDLVWIFSTYRDFIPAQVDFDQTMAAHSQVDEMVQRFAGLWNAVGQNSTAYVLQNNADLPHIRTFGNFDSFPSWGRTNYLKAVNQALPDAMPEGGTVVDMDYLSSLLGKENWFDERYWIHAKQPFSFDCAGPVAHDTAKLISGIKGKAKKCLVLDLDNTLWGGVIGDDGLEGIKLGGGPEGEAFAAFQEYILGLKKRGIILTVCSKNEEENAKSPFQSHPDMRLGLDDIAVFVANWNNKADNIKSIASSLDLGLDSFVFVDDNPAERKLVKDLLPMVEVPEMPADPSQYIRTLDELRFFETTAFSSVDVKRADMYRENAQRNTLKNSFTDLSDFLESLDMVAQRGSFDSISIPRVSQLINRSNQFHLTTTRYTEAEIAALKENPNTICIDFKLHDKFGDNGLICVIILKIEDNTVVIDTWAMSCRVLSREMEFFVFNTILTEAKRLNAKTLIGLYKPTAKNVIVKNLYKKLGFTKAQQSSKIIQWELNVSEAKMLNHHIRENTHTES